jgi:hypothetical protein
MKFSASELVKKSASQILYMTLKKLQYKATDRQLKGNEYADKIVLKEEASSEKRGVVQLKEDNLLFFCIDMIKDNKFIEIKMVDERPVEEWYLLSSINQSAFYASLLKDVKTLDTPKFRKKEGFKQEIIFVPDEFNFELWFGKDKYLVQPNDKLKDHYLNKADIIHKSILTKSFDEVREFDLKYKHKEFEIFKPVYKKLKK